LENKSWSEALSNLTDGQLIEAYRQRGLKNLSHLPACLTIDGQKMNATRLRNLSRLEALENIRAEREGWSIREFLRGMLDIRGRMTNPDCGTMFYPEDEE
jgi:hypothetical protein